jgi:hypothetical protein
MNVSRRDFVKATLAASAASTLPAGLQAAAGSTAGREYYELRAYRLRAGASKGLLDAYLEKAALPALSRRGVKNVGVFTELEVNKPTGASKPLADSPVWVLIPHASLDTFAAVTADLNADPAVQQAGRDYLQVGKDNPAYTRIDSWLHIAFTGMPKMEVPEFSRNRTPTRFFEMRSYESYSESKALKKIAMFNDGETALMKKLGMAPVFFGQALTGRDLPHLTYITSAKDLATHLENWRRFPVDPDWVKMRDDPQYADTVSKNTPHYLVPTAYSEL